MLLQKFKINTDKIKRRNEELIELNWIDRLSPRQKKFLNWRKGAPKQMNRDGLFGRPDLSTYLLDPDRFCEIPMKDMERYMTIYEVEWDWNKPMIENMTYIMQTINRKRIRAIHR